MYCFFIQSDKNLTNSMIWLYCICGEFWCSPKNVIALYCAILNLAHFLDLGLDFGLFWSLGV
jgi:hypothetical protein